MSECPNKTVKPIKTTACTSGEAFTAFGKFMNKFQKEGIDLRMEYIEANMNGQRITFVFDWEDHGC